MPNPTTILNHRYLFRYGSHPPITKEELLLTPAFNRKQHVAEDATFTRFPVSRPSHLVGEFHLFGREVARRAE